MQKYLLHQKSKAFAIYSGGLALVSLAGLKLTTLSWQSAIAKANRELAEAFADGKAPAPVLSSQSPAIILGLTMEEFIAYVSILLALAALLALAVALATKPGKSK